MCERVRENVCVCAFVENDETQENRMKRNEETSMATATTTIKTTLQEKKSFRKINRIHKGKVCHH